MIVVKVRRKGVIVLPKSIREALGIDEGTLLILEVRNREIVLKPLNLWERLWGCAKGLGSTEEAELELDNEELEDASTPSPKRTPHPHLNAGNDNR